MRNKSTRKSSLDTSSMPRQKEAHPPVQRISASLACVALVLRPTSSTSKWRTLKVRKTQINTQMFLSNRCNEIRESHNGRVYRYPAGTATAVQLVHPTFVRPQPLIPFMCIRKNPVQFEEFHKTFLQHCTDDSQRSHEIL